MTSSEREAAAAAGKSPNVTIGDRMPALRAVPTGERRHLTVLFCDLVGSTAISAQLDPEEWREVVANYHRAATDVVERFGGRVAKYLGDGVMAYFGWPEAHENDAESAVRAGLALLESIGGLNTPGVYPQLSARVGIDSGAVVIGVGAGNEADVFGDAPNIAARVQSVAVAGTAVVTAATHQLISGLFVVEELGAQALKGIAQPLRLYRVLRPSGARGRLEALAATHGLTSFIGRAEELRTLMNRWERVREGEGQVVTIIGEAGIGKSRLLQHFRERIGGAAHTWLECAAAPFFQNTPFFAVAEMLRQSLHWDQRLAALEASLNASGLEAADALSFGLLPESPAENYTSTTLTPEQERKRLLATLVGWTLGAAQEQPLVIATEDLHWADPSTLELIQLLVEQGATARLMLLYTARPEFRPPWPLRAHHTQLNLSRLNARDIRAMVHQVAARKALADEAVAAVVERTGGVPLFVEELTRALLESGEVQPNARAIPATLHDSLMARLDRLGPAKEVAQIAAVIGGEFSYALLEAVHPAANELQESLAALADAELVSVRGFPPDATYQFKHALIRDAAYEALLKSRRRELHRRVARALVEKFPAIAEAQPEVLARHWTEADENERAIAEWERAARAAEARSAFHEAQESYERALALIAALPATPGRDQLESRLRSTVSKMREH